MPSMIKRYEQLFSGIKVLHLISSGGLFGAERVILNLASQSKGITAYVGCLHNKHNPHLEIIKEANVLNLNTAVFDSQGQIDLRTINAVKKFLIDNKIDIIHTHNYKADIIGFAASKLANVKWVATNHLWHSTDNKLRFYEGIDAVVLKSAKKVIGVSSAIVDDLKSKGFNEQKLEVIDNGIPIERYNVQRQADLRLTLGIYPDEYAVVIVGRLAVEKGHAVFLEAAARVLETFKNVKFLIVGDGLLKDNLVKQASDLNIVENTIFVGIREDIPLIYALSDVMVNASYNEGLPMTILEAMAAKLPIIATNVGAVGEAVIHEHNGLLLEPGNSLALSSAILDLLKHKEKRQRFADKAYDEVCARYSNDRMAVRYNAVYEEVMR